MNRNSNLNPLPWYETIEEQGFRKHWAYGNVWPLIAHRDYLLPFQIVFPETPSGTRFFIHQMESGRSFEITSAMSAASFNVYSGDYVVGIFPALYELDWSILGVDFNNDFDESFGGEDHTSIGRYYLSMEYTIDDVTKTMYSEVMTLVDGLSCFLKLEWFSYENLPYNGGVIVYDALEAGSYVNYLYIKADIAMPDYTFEEEGEERDGFFFATKQTSEKTYRFAFLATEEVCDALRIVGLSDLVAITDQWGRRYICDKFSMTPEWQQQGYLASVACEFQTDTVVIRRAQAYTAEQAFHVVVSGDVSVIIQEIPGPHGSTTIHREIRVPSKEGSFIITGYPSLTELLNYLSSTWFSVEQLNSSAWRVTYDRNESGETRGGTIMASSGSISQTWLLTQLS